MCISSCIYLRQPITHIPKNQEAFLDGMLFHIYINNQYTLLPPMLVLPEVTNFDAVCRGAIQHISLTKNKGVAESPMGWLLLYAV
jgi:hypothetical protein